MNEATGTAPGRERASRIAIVGGGASGTLVAANLLRMAEVPLEIELIDESGDFGPGIPYRTPNPEHRLNVPACRMSAWADDPDHYLNWRRSRDPEAAPEEYTARSIYGEYLQELLETAATKAPPFATLGRLTDRVAGISFADGRPVIRFPDRQLEVDQVVIATGPVPGGDPVPVPEALKDRGLYLPSA
ncbi:MAG TPA: FAD/NAD(P)-binding protein, partial [Solirubrobacterales bacterium]|nr:FAD/NAD(P)-binding protein [Solirubrobacterales bacterium]